jgi:hypothetical protein
VSVLYIRSNEGKTRCSALLDDWGRMHALHAHTASVTARERPWSRTIPVVATLAALLAAPPTERSASEPPSLLPHLARVGLLPFEFPFTFRFGASRTSRPYSSSVWLPKWPSGCPPRSLCFAFYKQAQTARSPNDPRPERRGSFTPVAACMNARGDEALPRTRGNGARSHHDGAG